MGTEASSGTFGRADAPGRGTTYLHLTRLAQGGMGTVDLCVRRTGSFQRLHAIKRPHPHLRGDDAVRSMFLDEARVAGGLRHANVVPVLDFGEDDDGLYLVMDYVEGVSLSRWVRHFAAAGEVTPVALALAMIAQVARGLHAAHELVGPGGARMALVHRDVSPQNILVGRDGVVRVTDFGISKAIGRASHTSTGLLKGKVGYMSPEQLRFEPIDRRSDLFALGVVMFELLTSERLYRGDDAAEVARRILDEPAADVGDRRPELPIELVELSFRLLAKDRDDRPATAALVAEVLDGIVADDGPPDVARSIDAYFGAELDAERERVQALLVQLPAASHPAGDAAEVAITLAPTSTLVTRRRVRVQAGIGFVAALAVPAFALSVWPRTPGGTDVAPIETVAMAPIGQTHAEVVLQLDTRPAGAMVIVDDRQAGPTPLRLVRPRGDVPVRLQLQVAGRIAATHEWVPRADEHLVIALPAALTSQPTLDEEGPPGAFGATTAVDASASRTPGTRPRRGASRRTARPAAETHVPAATPRRFRQWTD